MATTQARPTAVEAAGETVYVDRFCDGIIGPSAEALGTVRDGGHIVANTAPGCWGAMITPVIMGGQGHTAGQRPGRRSRRRDRDPHPLDRRHVDGDGVGQRPHDRGPLQRRPLLRRDLVSALIAEHVDPRSEVGLARLRETIELHIQRSP